MLHRSRIASLAAGAMVLLSSGVSAAEQCPVGEKALEFRFFTDSSSWKDNGWILECDDMNDKKELVWSIPIGSIDKASHTQVIREAACVPDTSTCTLKIFDASSDGLQGDNSEGNSFVGWFALLHGATTVATYKSVETPEFSELTYCVGPNCDQEPQEVHDEDCQDIVYLAMQLDNNPTDTSYQLVCGGEDDGIFDKKIIWNGSGFTQPGAFVEEETCLPKNACCEFIVVDGTSNGLTDTVPQASRTFGSTQAKGFIYLEKNFEPVLEYDGSTGEEFGVLTKRFACAADNQPEEEQTPPVEIAQEEEELLQEEFVGNLVDGVFDPKEEVAVASDIPNFNDEYGITWEGTYVPTSEDWVSDDDYQNFNDDGQGFGKFDDAFGGVFTDDVYETTSTSVPSAEFQEHDDYRVMFDDVTEEDDVAWAFMDDEQFPMEGMNDIEGMIQDLNDHIINLPSDPNAINRLNEQGQYLKQSGLSKGGKIAVGVLVPLFILWTIGLVGCYYFGPEVEDTDDSSNEKGTAGEGSDLESLQAASVECGV